MPQHELLTDGPPPEAPEPAGLMDIRFNETGLGNTFVPDECDTLGIVTHGHSRVTQLIAELFVRTGVLGEHAKRVNDRVQALPDRVLVDAIMADTFALQRQVGMLFDETRALRQDIQALLRERAA